MSPMFPYMQIRARLLYVEFGQLDSEKGRLHDNKLRPGPYQSLHALDVRRVD